jgi:hypothetical protein
MIQTDKDTGRPLDPPAEPRNPGGVGSKAGKPQHSFAELAYRSDYSFPGLASWIDAHPERFADHGHRSRARAVWFVSQASNALANACHQKDPKAAQAGIDIAVQMRDALHASLLATEAAIVETASQLGLPEPPFARKPEKPHAKHHGK